MTRMRFRRIGLIGLVLWLAGCESVSTPTNPATPWKVPAHAQKPDNVWTSLREQKQDFSKPMTLAELVDIALQNNPTTRRHWNDARAAAAQVQLAKGYFMPALTATVGADRRGLADIPADMDQDYMKYGPGLRLNYLVFNFAGGRKAALEQALQTVYAANFTFNRSIQDVLLAVETAYYALISAEAGIAAAEASVKDANTALDATKARRASDTGTELEVLQAQANHDASLYRLAVARGQARIARGSLDQAMGIPADTMVQVAAPTMDVPDTLAVQDIQRLIDESLDRRPDIAALRASLAASQAAVKVAGSARWPSLYVSGGISRDYYDTMAGKEFQDHDWSYDVGVSLQWPLFDGFQTASAKSAALAQAESIKARLKEAELAASADVWASYHNYDTALQKHRFSMAYLESASASYDMALESYQGGLRSILDLLNAETQLAQARGQHIAARQEAFTSLAGLAYAVGLLEKGGAMRNQAIFSISTGKDKQP